MRVRRSIGGCAGILLLFTAGVRLLSAAAPPSGLASNTAPDASSSATAAFVLPLSQATAVPLYRLYYPAGTDHFYTTSASERDYAKSLGYLDQGVAAYVEPAQIAGTLPFQRFYMGYPRTDHFYTADAGEAQLVLNFGFTYEGIEGYVYTTPVDGSVPLHRLSWCGGGSSDCDHLYTIDPAERDQVLTWGWGYDGVAGYVWPVISPPTGAPNAAGFVSQSVPISMVLGQSYPVSVTMRNSGTNTWSAASAYRLGSQNPQDNLIWGIGRVGVTSNVPPGATVTFTFSVTPSRFGSLNFQWRMVQDGVEWFGDVTPNIPIAVSQAAGADDAAFVSQSVPLSMTPGQTYAASVTMTNTGGTTWTASNLYRLGSQNPQDNLRWGLARASVPNDVPPGASVEFQFNVVAPITPGTYNFQWQMLREAVAWFGQATSNVAIQVIRQPGDDPLLVQIDGQSVTIRNLAAQTTHLYPFILPCKNSVADGQTDLNGLPGREVIISGPCSDMVAIDDANGRVYRWQVPIARSRRILIAETDPFHPGKEIIAWTYPIDVAQTAKLYSVKLAHDNIAVNVGVADLPSTASLIAVTDLDGNGEDDFAITNTFSQEVLHYKDAAGGPYLWQRYRLPSVNLFFFAPVDTDGNRGAEMVVGRNYLDRVGISIINFTRQSVRDYYEYWYTISPNMIDRDGQPGAEVCFFNGSRWRMIVDRIGVIVNGVGCP